MWAKRGKKLPGAKKGSKVAWAIKFYIVRFTWTEGGDSTPPGMYGEMGKRNASIVAKISIEPPDHFLMMNPIKK